MLDHDLLATSWTWDGDEPIDERVRAVGDAGFAGISLALDDLHEVRATIGFAELRRMLDGAGIVWVQLGTLGTWWTCPNRTTSADAERGVILEAAASLSAWQVVARADVTLPGVSPAAMLDDWAALARQAEGVGAQLVLEPEPWSNLPTVERASRFITTAGAGGLLLDAMHALRGGSTLASIRQGVAPATLAAVELSDGLLATPAGMTLAEESRSARYLPGAGAWDLPGFVRIARELGHDEPWGVEVRTPAHRALPVRDALRMAAAATRAVLDAADAYGAPVMPAMPRTPAPTSAVDFEPVHRPRRETGSGAPA
ncbi:sugar phosphate isomerase/epimerase [Curtobacterium sp. VKM Ac-2922]|uniref:sugar phosphate isomerase/epimerase family protein n=1 Tax=Curtobacterium sp. VKM Ac-2922 TaxID=2929475 RepID=UPI001FB5325B|nr:TIM barrel protein [Curtobacterium sp. VKM Ac-2922]MCJ1715944.1 sugar phosphate isomerase/epimerase [Curtobacterium sp. VKM Ac-2922]